MDKYSDMLADILFSIERISNTLRVVAGKEPQDCGFPPLRVPATEESLPLIANLLDDVNESLVEIFSDED